MAKLISKTYGEALFELAVEENKIDIFMEEIQGVMDVLLQNADFGKLMNHPKVTVEEKIEVATAVFSERISREIVGFLILIIQKKRYAEIYPIMEYFLDRVKELKGIGVAYVTTPLPLKEDQKVKIQDKLLQTTTYQTMEMHFLTDEKLIGGMQIRIGDRVVDSSVWTKLMELQKELLKVTIQA